MMKKLFGGGKEEKKEPAPPKLHEMDPQTLKETQKGFQKKLNKEVREVEKQIFRREIIFLFFLNIFLRN